MIGKVSIGKIARWFERGVKEAIWERGKAFSEQTGGLIFHLSHAWDQVLTDIPCQLTPDQSFPINTITTN